MKQTSLASINILGIRVHALTIAQLFAQMKQFCHEDEHALVLNVNVHCMNLSYQYPWLRKFLNEAEIVFCDGAGVMLGALLLGERIPERITYADWMWQLCKFAQDNDFSLFFVGARPMVAERAAEQLRRRFPRLSIVGVCDGYFDKAVDSIENHRVIQKINEACPNILVLGLGMPIQEKWLLENWHRLNVNVALTGGAVFDYVSGELRRAPPWMTDYGLEWLGRLIIEPRRLWRRYVVGNPLFIWRVIKQRAALGLKKEI